MALTELETRRVAKALDELVSRKRPPAHLRDQRPFAKATWIRTQNVWKIYWQRADLKWHSYEPVATVQSIHGFCTAVEDDPYGCFWG